MSLTETRFKRGLQRTASIVNDALDAGIPALLLVGIGGLSLGAFLWYALVSHVHRFHAADDAVLFTALAFGLVLAFVGWYGYARYFSRRTDASFVAALRFDALSWAALLVFVFGFALPLHILSPARATALAIALWGVIKLVVAARFNQTVREVLVTFVVTRIPIIAVAELAASIIGQRAGTHVAASSNPALAVWGRWDAVHYLDIATRGYYGTDMAFFPLYPTLIHYLGLIVGSHLIAGLLISNAAFFFGLLFFYKLVEHQYNRAVAHRAIFYLSIFPTAVFFSAVYTEALFFALTVASFYYIREHRWVLAGLLGGLAALTRVEGVLLAVPYALEVLLPGGASWRVMYKDATWRNVVFDRIRSLRVLFGAALIPLGLALYMTVLWVLHGDPLYFSHVQAHWDRHLSWPWVSVIHAVKVIMKSHTPVATAGQVIELAFTALMIAVLLGGMRRLRLSFWTYMALSIIVPMSTSSLMSMPRFALVLFPMFTVLALWGGRSSINNTIVAFSLPLLGLFTVLFADWYWVA